MMAAACKYFEEDAVYRVNKRGNLVFGLVLENSEFVSSDEEDEEKGAKDVGEWEPIKKGQVRVAWHPKGVEEVLPERKVYLADRSLMPGDVVRQVIKGRDTQRGYCRNVDVRSSVHVVGSHQVIYNVNSKDLTPLDEFNTDIAVLLDSWVGMVKFVKAKIYIKCSDGSRCVLGSEDACDLDDVRDVKRDRGSEFRKYDFYPGQQLWGKMSNFENAEWLQLTDEMKSWKNKPTTSIRAVVEDVKVVELGIHWQCQAYSKDSPFCGSEQQQPKFIVHGDDLKRIKMLNVYEPCTLQLGDRSYYTIKDSDLILTKEHWRRLERDVLHDQKVPSLLNGSDIMRVKSEKVSPDVKLKKDKVLGDEQHRKESSPVEQNDVADTNDSDYEDVEDEDVNTSDSASISSRSSISSAGHIKKVKNRPTLVTKVLKNKKLKRAKKRILVEAISLKPGEKVVVETLSTISSAEVVWQDGSVESDVLSTALYPIHHLDDQEFFPGDFVVENRELHNPRDYGVVRRVDHSGRTALVQWMKTYTEGAEPSPVSLQEEEVSVYDLKDHPDFKYRPGSVVIRVANFENEDPMCTAGQVLDVHPSGMVEVSWINTERSFCYPQDLYKVGEYDSDEGELWDDGDESDDSWETESELSITAETHTAEVEDCGTLRQKLATNIEKARASMARLEEIFTQNPALQTLGTMKQILGVYKDCKYLDHLMSTTYFHESHFQGLLERVRDRGRVNSAQRVAEQVSRLFKQSPDQSYEEPPEVTLQLCTAPHDKEARGQQVVKDYLDTDRKLESFHAESTESGVSSLSDVSHNSASSQQIASDAANSSVVHPLFNMCARLCSLLKVQLLRAHEDVMKRFSCPSIEDVELSPHSNPPSPCKSIPNVKDGAEPGVASQPDASSSSLATSVDLAEDKEHDAAPVPIVTGTYSMMETAPDCHKFKLSIYQPTDPKMFFRTVRKETKLLRTSIPEGIVVKGFDDRMDLYSVMIKGPARTPYEDGLFLFDVQLSADYPKMPPVCHYISYCSDRLNPNLYEDGKVCVSLLGTWGGKGTEIWTATSNLLQVIVSIQGLILVSEPYFNEAGYERQKGTQQGKENSRMYNEMVILKLVQAMSKLLVTPPEVFYAEIVEHFKTNAYRFIHRLEKWLEISEAYNGAHPTTPTTPTAFREIHGQVLSKLADVYLPEFPLIPASKGFCITLHKTLQNFKEVLATVDIHDTFNR